MQHDVGVGLDVYFITTFIGQEIKSYFPSLNVYLNDELVFNVLSAIICVSLTSCIIILMWTTRNIRHIDWEENLPGEDVNSNVTNEDSVSSVSSSVEKKSDKQLMRPATPQEYRDMTHFAQHKVNAYVLQSASKFVNYL